MAPAALENKRGKQIVQLKVKILYIFFLKKIDYIRAIATLKKIMCEFRVTIATFGVYGPKQKKKSETEREKVDLFHDKCFFIVVATIATATTTLTTTTTSNTGLFVILTMHLPKKKKANEMK